MTIMSELGYELPKDFKGIYINDISEDCDIANTALEIGDFITKIDGVHVETYDELYDTISASYGAGDTVPATCAKVDKDGNIEEYDIEFMLMEDTSGDY
jgi:serine protease Do